MWQPPQLAVSFFPDQARDGAYWHRTVVRPATTNVWSRETNGLKGSIAIR